MTNLFLIRDPLTRKKSYTITMLALTFGLLVTCLVLFLIRYLTDIKVGLLFFMVWGTLLAIYQQKRIKINFTGVEMAHDPRTCKGERDVN